MLRRSVPIFAVRDVKETIAFYKDVLGFEDHWYWGDPITFGGANWGDVSVMFCQQPEVATHIEGHQHHYWSDDFESLHARHAAAGAVIVSPIGNKPWGIREYTVRDPNGYHLRFSGPQAFTKPDHARATLPDFVRIDVRTPTEAEYRDLHAAVHWPAPDEIVPPLNQNLFSVVATDTRNGKVVGMLRVMRDARSWFSIWDVIVHPSMQAQQIGTSMLKAATTRLRQIQPNGGHAHLFTHQDAFYEKNGFSKDTCLRIAF